MRTPPSEPARIGPNAATQLIAALREAGETETLERLFGEAGRAAWLGDPPQRMIAADDAARLHVGLRRLLPEAGAEALGGQSADAGHRRACVDLRGRGPVRGRRRARGAHSHSRQSPVRGPARGGARLRLARSGA